MINRHQVFLERKDFLESLLGEPIEICGLTGPLRLFQRRHGHRQSIDDTITAWYALQKFPGAKQVLDLGAGVGIVGMIVLWGLVDQAKLTAVERQRVSYVLLCENILCNGLEQRVIAIHEDLRDLKLDRKFQLVTASPPYFPPHAGTIPKDSQKAHARFELHGHLGDYAKAAKQHLEERGLFVYCFPFRQKQRGLELVTREGFHVLSIRDVLPKKTTQPLFSVYVASLQEVGPTVEEAPLIVQGADGCYSAEMLSIQATRGFGPEGSNKISC